MHSFLRGALAFILLVFITIGAFTGYELSTLKPVNDVKEDVYFTIDPGSSAKGVLRALERENLIRNTNTAYFYIKFIGDANFKAGTFKVNDNMSAIQLIEYLSDEHNILQDSVTVTITEGTWLKDMAEQIAEVTVLDAQDLLDYWKDPNVFAELSQDYSVLTADANNQNVRYYFEGYLFPDTYKFLVSTTCEQVTRKMLDQTQAIYEKLEDQFNKSKLSVHEIFTLASIVQFEGNTKDSMYEIAGIFMNRLNGLNEGRKRLESSVTVCYAIDAKGQVCELSSSNEASKNNLYNTYYHDGLTPGPICAPGQVAIEAVLNPNKTSNLFFFADSNGNITYSKTYSEHQSTYGG